MFLLILIAFALLAVIFAAVKPIGGYEAPGNTGDVSSIVECLSNPSQDSQNVLSSVSLNVFRVTLSNSLRAKAINDLIRLNDLMTTEQQGVVLS